MTIGVPITQTCFISLVANNPHRCDSALSPKAERCIIQHQSSAQLLLQAASPRAALFMHTRGPKFGRLAPARINAAAQISPRVPMLYIYIYTKHGCVVIVAQHACNNTSNTACKYKVCVWCWCSTSARPHLPRQAIYQTPLAAAAAFMRASVILLSERAAH